MEAISATLLTFGLAFLLLSWVLLLITSWREDFTWGLCSVLLPPLAYLYGLARLDVAGSAIGLALLGCFLILIA